MENNDRNHLPGAAWWTVEILREGGLMNRMNKFTLLGAVISAFYYPIIKTTGLIDDFIKRLNC